MNQRDRQACYLLFSRISDTRNKGLVIFLLVEHFG